MTDELNQEVMDQETVTPGIDPEEPEIEAPEDAPLPAPEDAPLPEAPPDPEPAPAPKVEPEEAPAMIDNELPEDAFSPEKMVEAMRKYEPAKYSRIEELKEQFEAGEITRSEWHGKFNEMLGSFTKEMRRDVEFAQLKGGMIRTNVVDPMLEKNGVDLNSALGKAVQRDVMNLIGADLRNSLSLSGFSPERIKNAVNICIKANKANMPAGKVQPAPAPRVSPATPRNNGAPAVKPEQDLAAAANGDMGKLFSLFRQQ